jgi:hypothetical protein
VIRSPLIQIDRQKDSVNLFKLGLLGIIYCKASNQEKCKALYQLYKLKDTTFPKEIPDLSKESLGGIEMTGKEGRLIAKIEKLFQQLVEMSSVFLMHVYNDLSMNSNQIYFSEKFTPKEIDHET